MAAKVKLNPTRLVLPKYGRELSLAMEYLSRAKNVLPTQINTDECVVELVLPYTKHSIRGIQKYINANI